jgi:hypothetical protein
MNTIYKSNIKMKRIISALKNNRLWQRLMIAIFWAVQPLGIISSICLLINKKSVMLFAIEFQTYLSVLFLFAVIFAILYCGIFSNSDIILSITLIIIGIINFLTIFISRKLWKQLF